MSDKKCTKCKERKARSEFQKDAGRYDGLQSRCRSCNTLAGREYRARYPERFRENWNRRYAKNREKILARQEAYRLKKLYDVLSDEIPDTCNVCGLAGRICVDHDHVTGKRRGFLCSTCNSSIGMAGDDANLLRKLADYLEKHHG